MPKDYKDLLEDIEFYRIVEGLNASLVLDRLQELIAYANRTINTTNGSNGTTSSRRRLSVADEASTAQVSDGDGEVQVTDEPTPILSGMVNMLRLLTGVSNDTLTNASNATNASVAAGSINYYILSAMEIFERRVNKTFVDLPRFKANYNVDIVEYLRNPNLLIKDILAGKLTEYIHGFHVPCWWDRINQHDLYTHEFLDNIYQNEIGTYTTKNVMDVQYKTYNTIKPGYGVLKQGDVERTIDMCAFESDHLCLRDLQGMFAIPHCDFEKPDDIRACWTRTNDETAFLAEEVFSTVGTQVFDNYGRLTSETITVTPRNPLGPGHGALNHSSPGNTLHPHLNLRRLGEQEIAFDFEGNMIEPIPADAGGIERDTSEMAGSDSMFNKLQKRRLSHYSLTPGEPAPGTPGPDDAYVNPQQLAEVYGREDLNLDSVRPMSAIGIPVVAEERITTPLNYGTGEIPYYVWNREFSTIVNPFVSPTGNELQFGVSIQSPPQCMDEADGKYCWKSDVVRGYSTCKKMRTKIPGHWDGAALKQVPFGASTYILGGSNKFVDWRDYGAFTNYRAVFGLDENSTCFHMDSAASVTFELPPYVPYVPEQLPNATTYKGDL
jgi:hypothetical protein